MKTFRPNGLFRRTLAALLLLGCGPVRSTPPEAEPRKQPNIILILADDLGYGSLGCYGNKEVRTPNIDRLAAGGIRFTDFHSNGPMCSPTRAALLTGRYPQRCAWVADDELSPEFRKQRRQNPAQRWAWGISTKELTVAHLLKQAGYRTALIGKWHLGYDRSFHPMNYGFDEFRGYVGGNVDYHTHVAGYGLKEVDWWNDRKVENEPGYTTDLLTKYAVGFIERNKDKPFFLYLAHEAPHEPWQGREPSRKKSPVEAFKEMIEVLDESVGEVANVLKANHLDTSTLLVFCSDNGAAAPRGFSANGRLKGRKGSMLEGGHRVPAIISWPGTIPAGSSHGQTIMGMDFFPTFAKLAGATIPEAHLVDGIDLMPLVKEEGKKIDRDLHWLFGDSWAVRRGAWKLSGQGVKPLALVNLEKDAGETDNLLEAQSELVNDLLRSHSKWIESAGSR